MTELAGRANVPVEIPLGDDGAAECDCVFERPDGTRARVPCFRDADGAWRVRYSSSQLGTHRFDGGSLTIRAYDGANPLYLHGRPRERADGRGFEHEDGTPFLWLGDTWWLAFVDRLGWPDDFRRLTDDRVEKGFSVVQLVAGLYPEMPPFDPRGGSWPWSEGFAELVPAWWDAADLKLAWLVSAGIVPCVVGAWGYHLLSSGVETMRRHWREVVARWAAYPVVWCLAGEATLPYYPDIFGPAGPDVSARLREGWREVARSLRELDPFGSLVTVHPSPGDGCFSSYDIFPDDPELFDFAMLQTGHWDRQSLPGTLAALDRDLAREPRKPVLNGEVCYEGILGSNWQETQRFLFWTHLLSGAAGHTYGAQGLWAMNDGGFVGEAGAWSDATWDEAYRLPGSRQLGLAKRLLERFPWWRLEPLPQLLDRHADERDRFLPYAAGIEGELALVYFPSAALVVNPPDGPVSFAMKDIRIHGLDRGWTARFWNPRTGADGPSVAVEPDAAGTWTIGGGFITSLPSMEDWVLVLERGA